MLPQAVGEDVRSIGAGDEVEVLDLGRIERRFERLCPGCPDRSRRKTRIRVGVVGVIGDRVDVGVQQALPPAAERILHRRVRL